MSLHRAGGKFTRNHTTLIDAAAPIVDRANELEEVSKIALGIIKVIGKGKPSVKFVPINGGWKVVVRGNLGLQEIFVYTIDPEGTRSILAAVGV